MSSPAAGNYPGNPSLPVEVRQKILMTFRHALGLFSSGQVSDCLIGCEFILKMDPRFTPAKRLQEKARNRDSDVDITDLQALVDPEAAGAAPAPASPAPASPPAPAASSARATAATATAHRPETPPELPELLAKAAGKLEGRDFDAAIGLATRALALSPGDREALTILEKAAGRKATQPLVESGRARAEDAIAEGRLDEARVELERIRALDSLNPAIGSLERRLASATSSTAGIPDQPDFSLDREEPFTPGVPGTDSGPSAAGASSEPFGLDPLSHPASLTEIEPSAGYAGEPNALDPPSPGEEALVPPPPPAADLFLPGDSGSVPSFPGGPPDEEAAQRDIAGLLKRGDDTASKGDRQQAIEIWSRIFLIDINNAEAVTRIEKARQEMAEEGKRVADLLRNGREAFESGDRDTARKLFLEVQSLDPEEATARFYLERLDQPKPEAASAAPESSSTGPAGPGAREEAVFAPASISAPAPPAGRKSALSLNPRLLAVVGAFLALALVGVYFVFRGGRAQEAPPNAAPASLARARELLGNGKIAEARAELKRIPPDSPDTEEAQRTLAELGKGGVPEARSKASPADPAGAASREGHGEADPARLKASAEKALEEKRYIEALKNFNLAAPAFRDDPSFSQKQGLAAEKVTALTPAVKFYNEGEYETAIPILWRILQEDRDNKDARSYLLRSYYNQGITQLQNGLYQKAAQAFQEALALDPNDAETVRHHRFAERYQKSDLDLMGRIYVRHLNHRP